MTGTRKGLQQVEKPHKYRRRPALSVGERTKAERRNEDHKNSIDLIGRNANPGRQLSVVRLKIVAQLGAASRSIMIGGGGASSAAVCKG